MRPRNVDEASLDRVRQHVAVRGNDVVGSDVRNKVSQDDAKFAVIHVTLLHPLFADAVRRMAQQVRF